MGQQSVQTRTSKEAGGPYYSSRQPQKSKIEQIVFSDELTYIEM